jgi:hypothetical protein
MRPNQLLKLLLTPLVLGAVLLPANASTRQPDDRSQNAPAKTDTTARRKAGVSIRTNLVWDGVAEPNLGVEFPIGKHWSLGGNAGIKTWPRWLFWDNDNVENTTHWRNFAVVPEARFYFDQVYDGWFIGADILYTHFNVGNVKFPFNMYPDVKEHRMQGDFVGLGAFGGYSWWLGQHWRLELEAGVAVGYYKAGKYNCDHCGALVDEPAGVGVVPKVGVNIAYNVRRRTEKAPEVIPPMPDTLLPPVAVPVPVPFEPKSFKVEEWKGVAGELAPKHPVLRPSSEYKPYTPERILRKEEGALFVFFEVNQDQLKPGFTEQGRGRDNGPVLDEIIDITAGILKDTTSSVSCIQIVGLASIEGPQPRNQRLAESRAMALQAYIQERLPVPDSLFETVGVGEAWTEFRDEVNDFILAGGGAGLTAEQLQKVMDIIDGEPDPDRREAKLKALEKGAVYQQLKRNVLADQRNSGYIRVYFDYVPDENARIINSAIDAIEAGEMDKAREIAAAVKDDPRAASVWECIKAYERHCREEKAYQQYLKELDEYNNSKQ